MDPFAQGHGQPQKQAQAPAQGQAQAFPAGQAQVSEQQQHTPRYRHVSAPVQQPQNLSSFQEGMRQDSVAVNASMTRGGTGAKDSHLYEYDLDPAQHPQHHQQQQQQQRQQQQQQQQHGSIADRSTGHVGIMIDNQHGHGHALGLGLGDSGHVYGLDRTSPHSPSLPLHHSPQQSQLHSQIQPHQPGQQAEPVLPAASSVARGHSMRGGAYSGMFQQGYSQYQGHLPGATLSRHLSIQLTPNPMLLPPPPPALHSGSHAVHSSASLDPGRDPALPQSRDTTAPPPSASASNQSTASLRPTGAPGPSIQMQQQQQQQYHQQQGLPRQSASPQSVTLPPPTAKYIRSPMRSPNMPQLSSQALAYAQAQSQSQHRQYQSHHGPPSVQSQQHFPPRTHRRSIQPLTLDQQQPKGGSFRYVRNQADLWPQKGSQKYRSIDPYGHSVSPLRALTELLTKTYSHCNRDFKYEPSYNPRRVLTKPSKPMHNEGYDNEDYDYILYVSDILGSEERQRYLILDVLGQGTFGQVVKCQNLKTHAIVAVKVIKNRPAYFNQSMMEVTVLELLNERYDMDDRHHILRLQDTFIHRRHLCLVFELLSVNLYELIKQNQFRGLSMSLVRVFTAQLLDALCVLNEARIIHCDLKPENVLLKNLETPTIKVIDFGSACHEQQTVYTYIQSRFYRSPEVLVGLPYSSSIDIWSVGCIAAELFLGLPLFPGSSEYNQLSRIVEMLGMLPSYMLEIGKTAHEFFEVIRPEHVGHSYGTSMPKKYRLKSMERYSREHGVMEQPSKRYFQATTLADIINSYPMMKKGMTQKEIEKEMISRHSFINFLQGLLNLNPIERWSPHQAKLHPFITGEPFTGSFIPPTIPKKPATAENSARLEPTLPGRSTKPLSTSRSTPSSAAARMSSSSSLSATTAENGPPAAQSNATIPANAAKSHSIRTEVDMSGQGAPPSLSALGGSMATSSESSLGSSLTDASSLSGSPAMALTTEAGFAGSGGAVGGLGHAGVTFAPDTQGFDSTGVQTSTTLPLSASLHHQQRPRATTMGTVEVPKNMAQLAAVMTPQQGQVMGSISGTSRPSQRMAPSEISSALVMHEHSLSSSPHSGVGAGFEIPSSSGSIAGYGLRQIPERSEHNSPVLDAVTDVDGTSSVDDTNLPSLSEASSAHHRYPFQSHHHQPQQQAQNQQQYLQQPRRYLHRSGSESLGKGSARTLRSVLEGSSSHAGEMESNSARAARMDGHSQESAAERLPSSVAELTPLERMQQQLNVGLQHQQQQSKQLQQQQQQHPQRYHFGYPQSGSSFGGSGTGGSSSGTDGERFGRLDLGSGQRSGSGTDESLDNSSNSDSSSGDEGEVEEMQELDGLGFTAEHRMGSGMNSHNSNSLRSRSVDPEAESPPPDSALGTATASFESPELTGESSFAPTDLEQVLSKVEEVDEDLQEAEDNEPAPDSSGEERGTIRSTHVLVDEDGSEDEEVTGTAVAGIPNTLGLHRVAEERERARQYQGQGQNLDRGEGEGHRHPTDHGCPKIEERRKAAEEEAQRRKEIQDAVADKFMGTGAGAGSGSGSGDQVLAKKATPLLTAEEKQGLVKAKAEAAKAAIAEARAKVAARGAGSGTAGSTGSTASSLKAGVPEAAAPKVKKASRVVALMKMKKIAQGDDKIALSARLYVHIKSPLFPHLDDKAVFVDKTWTVGRSLDRIVEWLKISVPKNEPFDAGKRFSIFSAKESDGLPVLLSMQDRLQLLTQIESGDIFYLAPADWLWKQQ
ncbi:Homeodomain-interacting protein kinase 3 [Mortierella alpina]|nr:Homeodomain-interacting protein kinase 3 [Mortierella alpina]